MTETTVTSHAPIHYLDMVAATEAGRGYKAELLAALDVRPGHHVLDLGCGPGTDLAALAEAVGPEGAVLGIDQDPEMVAKARQRLAGYSVVEVREADAHALPLDAASMDRARVDRVLMHVANPAAVLAELHRVLRPGGLLTLAEPDWDTLAIDHPDLETTRAFTRYIARRANRNAAIGRQLPRLAADAGFTLTAVRNVALIFDEFDTADAVLGLRRNTDRAVAAGYLSAQQAGGWWDYLATHRFFGTASLITVLARA